MLFTGATSYVSLNLHIFQSVDYLGHLQYLCHLKTALSFNSHFHLHFWWAYSEIFRSFYECKECSGEPQDSPTYNSPFQLPAACQILINEKVASSYSCWFSLFLSGEFLNRVQNTEPSLTVSPSFPPVFNVLYSSQWNVLLAMTFCT